MCVYAQAHMLQHAKGACERMSNKREQLVEVGSFLYSLHVGPGIELRSSGRWDLPSPTELSCCPPSDFCRHLFKILPS